MFFRNGRLMSDSMISSSASRGCRGKEAGEDLQALMAQVRKLRVRSFILVGVLFSSSSFLWWRTRVGTGIEVARGGGGWVGCDVMWWDDGWAVGWVQYKFLVG